MEYFKISFGSGTALDYVEYGRDEKKKFYCEVYLIEDAGKEEARGTRARRLMNTLKLRLWERNDVMKVGRVH